MHVNTSQKTAILVKLGHIYEDDVLWFPSDVLQLLCLNSVIHGASWKQHVGCLQTEAAAAAVGSCW